MALHIISLCVTHYSHNHRHYRHFQCATAQAHQIHIFFRFIQDEMNDLNAHFLSYDLSAQAEEVEEKNDYLRKRQTTISMRKQHFQTKEKKSMEKKCKPFANARERALALISYAHDNMRVSASKLMLFLD